MSAESSETMSKMCLYFFEMHCLFFHLQNFFCFLHLEELVNEEQEDGSKGDLDGFPAFAGREDEGDFAGERLALGDLDGDGGGVGVPELEIVGEGETGSGL
eukprot:TRINITY_DN12201_c0_g1_i1.p1 TRINITY_DN12201_c0_g1~~TRINITY_DN12201_c0_g1_i1.p1  ORF type:complete len:101 (+),score=20.67 TRINITY_DN12201_c0_g1_i1:113-415(+)